MFDSHLNIRVNQREFDRFQKMCKRSRVDVSPVLRALMNEVATHGLMFDAQTGLPTLKRKEQ